MCSETADRAHPGAERAAGGGPSHRGGLRERRLPAERNYHMVQRQASVASHQGTLGASFVWTVRGIIIMTIYELYVGSGVLQAQSECRDYHYRCILWWIQICYLIEMFL